MLDGHRRYLLSHFRHLDQMLGEISLQLRPADDARLFHTVVPDADDDRRRVLDDYVAQMRFILRSFMQVQQLRDDTEPVSALRSFRVAMSFAATSIEELRPRYLRGYGSVEADVADAVERLAADLLALVQRIENYLDRGADAGPLARLAQFDAAGGEAALLRELDRVIGRHGLVELRTPLQQLVERVVAPRLEIAVFGRVNAGKSSLLNWWLGRPLLPTGVTPVTVVPTRICHGEPERAQVRMAGADPARIAVEELSGYVSEEHNDGNRKRVLDIEVWLRAARLPPGVCLVDTPGVASLARAGAARTLEYLPRCDLAVLLIEAGAALTAEEQDIARAIVDGGSELLVAMSKADRLSDSELPLALAYLEGGLRAPLQLAAPVLPLSTLPARVPLLERWYEQQLEPRLSDWRARTADTVGRKTQALRETVMASLQARLGTVTGPVRIDAAAGAVHMRISQARLQVERVRAGAARAAMQTRQRVDEVSAAASEALRRGWLDRAANDARVAALVQVTISRDAAACGDVLMEQLEALRRQLQQALAQAVGAGEASLLPAPRGRPLFDVGALQLPSAYPRPHGLWTMPPLLQSRARRSLRSVRAPLARQLGVYADALRYWSGQYLDELSLQFEAGVAALEGVERATAAAGPDTAAMPDAVAALRADLQRLRDWRRP
jgi:GTP-binding protein EngB required for normal cell division